MMTTKNNHTRPGALMLCLVAAVVLLTSGCLESKDHLRLNADGSGRWTYKVTPGPQMAAMMAEDDDLDGAMATLTAAGVKAAAKQTKGVTLVTCEETREGDRQTLSVDLTFDSIADLASGPFASQLAWELKSEDNQLVIYSKEGPFGDNDDDGITMNLWGMKPMFVGLKTTRIVTLPNPIRATNAPKKKDRTAGWAFAVKADTSEAAMKKMGDFRPRAACAMTGVTMKLPVELVIPEDEEEEAAFGGKYVETPATQSSGGISLQPIHVVVRRDLHYIPTDIIAMGTPMRLTFECTWPEDVTPAGYSGLTVTAATDNSGADLQKDRPANSRGADVVHELKIREDDPNRARFEIDFVELPARDATTFSVSGHFVLHVPKRVVPVKIETPEALVGKPLEHPALAELAITLKQFRGGLVELSSKNDLGVIQKMRLESADGSASAKAFSTSSSKFGDRYTRRMHVSGTNKLKAPVLVLLVAEDVERQRVDFEFVDLTLP